MHSGQYDKDCVTWNPQGEIPQINYVLNAVTNGTVVAGARSKKFSVLAGYKKRQQQQFSSFDEKLFKVDHHCGMAIAGLTADARVLADYMRSECLHHKYVFDEPMPIGRLVAQLGDKAQEKTLNAGKRPYGVGLLVSSFDNDGVARIHEFAPSGDWYEYHAIAIGSRAQSAKTYLEKNFESFPDCSKDALIKHVIKSVSVTMEQDVEMTVDNIDCTVVGEGQSWHKLSKDELRPIIAAINAEAPAPMEVEEDAGDA